MKNRIVICAALPLEIHGFLRSKGKRHSWFRPDRIEWRSGEVNFVALTSGEGFKAMEYALKQVGECECETLWISYGFAGGLQDHIKAGDVLMGNCVIYKDQELQTRPAFDKKDSPCLLCRKKAVVSPEEKKTLGEEYETPLVDMESAAVALHAAERSDAFGWIKGISDPIDEALPVEMLSCMNRQGVPSITKAIMAIARKPPLLGAFIKMAIRTGKLSNQLGNVLSNNTFC